MRVHEGSIPATPSYPELVKKRVPLDLDFHERLAVLRKEPRRNIVKAAERRLTENGGDSNR